MEGAPFIPEYQNDDPERREKHVPKAESIGSLAVETKAEKDPDYRQQSHEHLGHALVSKEALQDKPETNFEQDPALRHQQSDDVASRVSSSIGGLIKNADLDLGSSGKASNAQARKSQPQSSLSPKKQRNMTDVIMVTVIATLLLLIILVIILKG